MGCDCYGGIGKTGWECKVRYANGICILLSPSYLFQNSCRWEHVVSREDNTAPWPAGDPELGKMRSSPFPFEVQKKMTKNWNRRASVRWNNGGAHEERQRDRNSPDDSEEKENVMMVECSSASTSDISRSSSGGCLLFLVIKLIW